MSWFGLYLWNVFASWLSVALLILGLNDISKWMGRASWEWLSEHRWKLIVVYLLIAQAMAYQKLATQTAPPPSPVVAENPDHARLAKLSAKGQTLLSDLRAKRADPDSRAAFDKWYDDVCSAMSTGQCAGFRSASPASASWVAYPAEDGGYSQTSRGRAADLSLQLTSLCR